MPQEFNVLKCFNCETFQVHQVKKVPKWSCKLCGEKQSTKKVYGRGTGAECRVHVQKLNVHRGSLQDSLSSRYEDSDKNFSIEEDQDSSSGQTRPQADDDVHSSSRQNSKWNKFVSDQPSGDNCTEDSSNGIYDQNRIVLNKDQYHAEQRKAMKRKREFGNEGNKSTFVLHEQAQISKQLRSAVNWQDVSDPFPARQMHNPLFHSKENFSVSSGSLLSVRPNVCQLLVDEAGKECAENTSVVTPAGFNLANASNSETNLKQNIHPPVSKITVSKKWGQYLACTEEDEGD